MHLLRICLPLAIAIGAGCIAPPRALEPDGAPGEVDHTIWDGLVREHVVDGAVDYPRLCREPALGSYLEQLARARVSEADPLERRLALLMNGYNALVVSQVCKGGSAESLFGRYRFFWRHRVALAGESLTLWDLEHERIRPLGEPRIHFAIVCASSSCPDLRSEAFAPEQLDRQLDEATRQFINDRSRNRIDPGAGVAALSKIFQWYEEDFLAEAASVARYVSRYVDDPEAARALLREEVELRYLPYDWSLNGPARAER
jgi:hypothetical protein